MKRYGSMFLTSSLLWLCVQPLAYGQTPPGYDGPLIKATVSIKGSDLIIDADKYTGPPDDYGGFDIAIKLPLSNIIAKNCSVGGIDGVLSVEMPDATAADPDKPSAKEQGVIQDKRAYYQKLLRLSKTDTVIRLDVVGSPKYLKKNGSELTFPYCSTVFSGLGEAS